MAKARLLHEDVSRIVIGAFYEVYNALGHGFLESIYSRAMQRELSLRGLHTEREVMIPVMYKGEDVGPQRLDILVSSAVVVEVKSTRKLNDEASRQLFNYLHATRLELGFLLHFGPEARFYPIACSSSCEIDSRIPSIPES